MKKVITLGELMLRLTPMHYNRFVQADRFRQSMEVEKQM